MSKSKMLPCLACNKLIGRSARTCPHCGEERNGNIWRLRKIVHDKKCSPEKAREILENQ
jgi:RNA polymerase subunit RPABC4/transcription elongation factor Spt4